MRRLTIFGLLALVACESDQLDAVRPLVDVDTRELDFGPVPEGTAKTASVNLTNPASVPAVVTVSAPEGSAEFTVEVTLLEVPAQGAIPLEVRYEPVGRGSDAATITITGEALETPITIALLGGPIQPCLTMTPSPLDFTSATSTMSARPFALRNECGATLIIDGLEIDVDGNQDFTLRGSRPSPERPGVLAPAEEVEVIVDYTKTNDAREGRVVATTNDPDEPTAILRLLPDPLRACQDGQDNDDDGLFDFPDDPGCTSRSDDDESNPPECDDGTTEACNTDVGECTFGTRTCSNRVWGPCEDATVAVPETCDGLDNDCDNRTDEELTGPCMINGCGGARACIEDGGGTWTTCIPTGGTAETCNGADDDCDGEVDEGVVEACMVNTCGGTRICVPGGNGEWTDCQITPMPETCNGVDDDCNGTADDGIPDLSCGVGACLRSAVACVMGTPNTCTPGAPGTETCNGADDDCNGSVDDGLPPLQCGVGACSRTAAACANGANNTCTPGAPGTEVCNGADDDCDGTNDNNIANLSCGVGVCARTAPACMNGANNVCVAGNPGTEICNNLDDDCDGTPDNLAALSCGVGVCARTVPACVGGVDNTCVAGVAGTEVCNGLDDDCDGTVDNGVCATCGLMVTTADPQEPNNATGAANPVVGGVLGTRVFDYDVTFPSGDTDWFEFNFTPPGSGTSASMTAEVTCVSWAGAGCGATQPTVGLTAWYIDPCLPQPDDSDNGTAGLAVVNSSGPISTLGICVPQRFRLNSYPTAPVCAGEAINAHVRVTVTFQ